MREGHDNMDTNGSAEGQRSTLISRNITVLGRRTSVRLEPEMWSALKEIAKREKCTIHDICTLIHMRKNPETSLTAAIRVFLMLYYRAASTEEGHIRAGHGSFDKMKVRARIMRSENDTASRYDLKRPDLSRTPVARPLAAGEYGHKAYSYSDSYSR